jgi:hypothetical protein
MKHHSSRSQSLSWALIFWKNRKWHRHNAVAVAEHYYSIPCEKVMYVIIILNETVAHILQTSLTAEYKT